MNPHRWSSSRTGTWQECSLFPTPVLCEQLSIYTHTYCCITPTPQKTYTHMSEEGFNDSSEYVGSWEIMSLPSTKPFLFLASNVQTRSNGQFHHYCDTPTFKSQTPNLRPPCPRMFFVLPTFQHSGGTHFEFGPLHDIGAGVIMKIAWKIGSKIRAL